jgi:CRISPR-associated protein Csd1
MGLLNALIASADRFKEDLLPIGYRKQEQPIWVINIDPAGEKAIVQKKQIDKVPSTPKDRTSSKVSPTLLVDKPSYVLGLPDSMLLGDAKAIAAKEHAAFVKLLFDAADATGNAMLKTIATFISNEKNLKSLFPTTPKKGELITFQVGSEAWPTDDPTIQHFWETYIQERLGSEERTCVVCGHYRRTTRIMPFPVKLFGYSPQILSFNESAFCSGGATIDSPFIASICFSCAGRIPQVLQHLLILDKDAEGKDTNSGRHAVVLTRDDAKKGTRQPLRNQVAVFWTKEPLLLPTLDGSHEMDELPRLTLADLEDLPEEGPPAYASQLREMLEAPWKGGTETTTLATNRFYLAILSPNKSRLVVREWLEQDIEPVRKSLRQYVNALQIIHPDGRGIWFPPLGALLSALQSPTSAKLKMDEKPRLSQIDLIWHASSSVACLWVLNHPKHY